MILITGANGFIGSALVNEFNSHGQNNIICTDLISPEDRPSPLKNSKYKKYMSADELWTWLKTDEASSLTHIYHLGACSDTTETNKDFLDKNNTDYTNKLFDYCAQKSIPFFYASSAAVYGDGDHGFCDTKEHSLYTPLNLYGLSKQKSDLYTTVQKGTPPAWYGLRFFNVYGFNEAHKDHMRSLVHKAYFQIKEHGSLKLFKSHKAEYQDGCQKRDFVYIKDITYWLYEMGLKTTSNNSQAVPSGIYNMGSGSARTWLDLATSIFTSLNLPVNIEWIDIPESIRDQYQYFTEADMTNAFESGLSKPQWPLEKGINDYIENYLNNESH